MGLSEATSVKPWSRTTLQPCGTHAAYRRHIRKGEDPCTPCSQARAAYQRDNSRRPSSALRHARAQALEALAHRHPEEFRRLYAAALGESQTQPSMTRRDAS